MESCRRHFFNDLHFGSPSKLLIKISIIKTDNIIFLTSKRKKELYLKKTHDHLYTHLYNYSPQDFCSLIYAIMRKLNHKSTLCHVKFCTLGLSNFDVQRLMHLFHITDTSIRFRFICCWNWKTLKPLTCCWVKKKQ